MSAITHAIVALAAAGAVWTVQDWRYGAKESDRVESQLENERLQAKAAFRRSEQIIAAQNEAQARARRLSLDAAAARTALDRLRTSTDDALRTARESHAACIVRADTLGELLNTVAATGGELAGKADRHANDAQTLSAACSK